jgi:thiol-disulfide isomerase/thioredoxin
MKFLHINDSRSDVALFNKYVEEGKDVFVLIFMVGCGPCKETIPKWKHIETVLKKEYAHNDNVVIADINKDLSSFIKNIGAIEGFPTMKYIGNKGKTVETYESSQIPIKDRSTNSFIQWIETKINRAITKRRTQRGGTQRSGLKKIRSTIRRNKRRLKDITPHKIGGSILL